MPQGSSHASAPHRVVVIVDEATNPFEMGVATELFGLPRPELGLARPLYELTLCAPAPDVRMNHGFFRLSGVAGLDAVDSADTLLVPGRPDNVVPRAASVRDAIRRTHARGARVVSFCTGSFALAEAGLLDGRRATTLPHCLKGVGAPPGAGPTPSAGSTRRSCWSLTCSSWTRATC